MTDDARDLAVVRDLLAIHSLLFGLYRDDGEGPAKWLSSSCISFDGETPLRHMLRDRKGITDVLEYLRSRVDHD